MSNIRTIRGCPVAVVGGAGFLGSHLVETLIEDRNCRVLVIDNLVAGRREFVHKDALFIHADITDSEEFLRRTFTENKIEYVFNYAAWPYVEDSYSRPLHVFNVNATGAIKVINAAQEAGCKGILQVSSAEIYGEAATKQDISPEPMKEGDPPYYTPPMSHFAVDEEAEVRPHSSYGASKAAVDSFVQVRWREAKTPVIALRQFNCVGERETHPYVVPEIISQLSNIPPSFVDQSFGPLLEGKAKLVKNVATVYLGNNSFRDFLYAGDAVRIAVELLERGEFGDVYNLGSESGIKIYDLAKKIGKLMGFADVEIEVDPKKVRAWEIWSLLADNTKLKRALGDGIGQWHPVPIDEALQRTINYYLDSGRKWVWEQ